MHVWRWRHFSYFVPHDKSLCPYALRKGTQSNHSTGIQLTAQPIKMPPHTSAYLLHHSNLVFNLYACPTLPSVSELQEWTTRHLSSPSFSPCSQLCLSALGQRCGSRLSRSHREAGVSLCTESHWALYIANSDALTGRLQDKELLCTPVRHVPHFGSFNLMQGRMLCALLQLALPPLLKLNGIQIGNIFFSAYRFLHFRNKTFLL